MLFLLVFTWIPADPQLGNIPGLEAIAANSAMTLEQRAQLIDLGLKLVAPFVSNADKLLQRVMATHQPTA